MGLMRLDKFLSETGRGTRSEVKDWCRKKLVTVNGAVCTAPERKIDPEKDTVTFRGETVSYASFHYYMLNKPAGVVSATEDAREKTVMDLLAGCAGKNLFPVGRLDKDTEGLLLITDDGDLAHRLLSPKKHVDKLYYVLAGGLVTEQDALLFQEGMDIGDEKKTLPAEMKILSAGSAQNKGKRSAADSVPEAAAFAQSLPESLVLDGPVSEVLVTLREGRFHQVKRMFEAIGKPVLYLKRLSMGSLSLDPELPSGAYRPLTEEEVLALKDPGIRS